MFRLDYFSCFLTVVSTLLVGRKHWSGLVVAGANSLIICTIGWRTSQFGFIPANLFCIGVYVFSLRSWRAPSIAENESTQAHLLDSPPREY